MSVIIPADCPLHPSIKGFLKSPHIAAKPRRHNNFCIGSALSILAPLLKDPVALTATYLFSVKLNPISDITLVEKEFGEETATLIKNLELTYPLVNTESTSEKDINQAEIISTLVNVAVYEPRVLFIRLAYSAAMLRDCLRTDFDEELESDSGYESLPSLDRAKRTANFGLQLSAPLAHRMGLFLLKNEIEESSFRILEPEEYSKIKEWLGENRRKNEQFLIKIREKIQAALSEVRIECEISSRVKEIYSIYKKTHTKNLKFDDLYDLLALRIIVENTAECYRTLDLVNSMFNTVYERFKDYISRPKKNGYRSLHLTLEWEEHYFEVQIRDKEMHHISETGVASHWSYKEKGKGGTTDSEFWLRRLSESIRDTENPTEVLRLFEGETKTNSVFVFTPKGKIVELPIGSTVLDFAYSIHSDIGNTCSGGKINGKMVPIRTELENGSHVEIITSKSNQPKLEWLSFTTTLKAQQYIRRNLREKEKYEFRDRGRKLFDKLARRLNIPRLANSLSLIKKNETPNLPDDILRKAKVGSNEEFFENVGRGTINENKLLSLLEAPKANPTSNTENLQTPAANTAATPELTAKGYYMGGFRDYTGIPYRMAQCCNPHYPEKVVGLSTPSGLKIHSLNCPEISKNKLISTQFIHLEWNEYVTEKRRLLVRYPADENYSERILNLVNSTPEVEVLHSDIHRAGGEYTNNLFLNVKDRKKYQQFLTKVGRFKKLSIELETPAQ